MAAISQSFRCFDEVARRGSLRKAAEVLHLTAAAVHQQVLNLEEQVGTLLFDRLPKGMQLTTAGEIMIAAIRRSQRDFDNALTQVEDLRALRRGHVSVAVPHATAEGVVPRVIARVTASHPGLTYTVRAGNGESILRWVSTGEADIGFCLQRRVPPGIEELRTVEQHLGVVTPAGHALTRLGAAIRMRDCLEQPLVLQAAGSELRTLIDQIDARERRMSRPLVETNSVAMARALVANGTGIAFMLFESVAQDVAAGHLAFSKLGDRGASCRSGIYQRAGQTTTVAMGTFLQFFESELPPAP